MYAMLYVYNVFIFLSVCLLVGWLVGWLFGWLVGWLVGWSPSPLSRELSIARMAHVH